MILVSLNKQSETGRAISSCGYFAVNILGEGDAGLAVRFAQKGGDKFEGVHVAESGCGAPILADALASLECRVVEEVSAATHVVFLAEVESASAREGTPLAYFRGRYGRLELAEGVLERGPGGEFVVPPLTQEAVEGALRARSAIESGAAALTVGSISGDELAEARTVVDQVKDAGSVKDWLDGERRFGDRIVTLARSPELLDAHRRIDVEAGLNQLRNGAGAVDGGELPDARPFSALLDAYEAGDLPAALEAIRQRADEVAQVAGEVIRAAGPAS
jgi:DNA-binding GntR family transcriptional regulator